MLWQTVARTRLDISIVRLLVAGRADQFGELLAWLSVGFIAAARSAARPDGSIDQFIDRGGWQEADALRF